MMLYVFHFLSAPRKQYKEDGKIQPSAAAPLKSQPYKDPGYDNGRDVSINFSLYFLCILCKIHITTYNAIN